MHATLLAPNQAPQQVSAQQLAELAPRIHDNRLVGSTLPPHLTAYTLVAAQLLGVDMALVDVFSSTAEHLIFAVFDHTTGRNKAAEQACSRLLSDDFFGDREPDGSDDEGHLFGPFLIIENN